MTEPDPGFERLQHAARDGDVTLVRSLLAAGVDPNADFGAPRGWSPLMHAAYGGHLAVAQLLLDRGARRDAVEVDRWGTALDIARDAGQSRMVELLAAAGVPPGVDVPNPHRGGRLGGWSDVQP